MVILDISELSRILGFIDIILRYVDVGYRHSI